MDESKSAGGDEWPPLEKPDHGLNPTDTINVNTEPNHGGGGGQLESESHGVLLGRPPTCPGGLPIVGGGGGRGGGHGGLKRSVSSSSLSSESTSPSSNSSSESLSSPLTPPPLPPKLIETPLGPRGVSSTSLTSPGALEPGKNNLLSLQICSIISAGSLGGSSVFTYRARTNQTIDSIKSEVLKIIKAANSSGPTPPATPGSSGGAETVKNAEKKRKSGLKTLQTPSTSTPPNKTGKGALKGHHHHHHHHHGTSKRSADGRIRSEGSESPDVRSPRRRDQLFSLLYRDKLLRSGTVSSNGLVDGARINIVPLIETGLLGENRSVVMVNMCAEEQDQFNNPTASTSGTPPPFSPTTSESSEYYYHHHQSVLDALEGLNDQQVGDFLGSRAPLNLTMRLGDHVMLIQLQLSKGGAKQGGSNAGESFWSRSSVTQLDPGAHKEEGTYASLTEASRKLTTTLKKLSSHVVSTSASFLNGEDASKQQPLDTCCSLSRKPRVSPSSVNSTASGSSLGAPGVRQSSSEASGGSPGPSPTASGTSKISSSSGGASGGGVSSPRTLLREDLRRTSPPKSTPTTPPSSQTLKINPGNPLGVGGGGQRQKSSSTSAPTTPVSHHTPTSHGGGTSGNLGGTRSTPGSTKRSASTSSSGHGPTSGSNSQTHSCPKGIHHHGKGVYSGTFSGTLNPYLQDNKTGRPKQHVSTIVHILNDLLSGIITNHQNFVSSNTKSSTSESPSTSTSPSSTSSSSSSSPSTSSSSSSSPSEGPPALPPRLASLASLKTPGGGDPKKPKMDAEAATTQENRSLREKIEKMKESLRLRRLRLLTPPTPNNNSNTPMEMT